MAEVQNLRRRVNLRVVDADSRWLMLFQHYFSSDEINVMCSEPQSFSPDAEPIPDLLIIEDLVNLGGWNLNGAELAQKLLKENKEVWVVIVVHHGPREVIEMLNDQESNHSCMFVDRLDAVEKCNEILHRRNPKSVKSSGNVKASEFGRQISFR